MLTVQNWHCNSPPVRSPLKSFARQLLTNFTAPLCPHITLLTQGNTNHKTLSVISADFILPLSNIYCRQMAYRRRAEASQNHIRCAYRAEVSTASEGINQNNSITIISLIHQHNTHTHYNKCNITINTLLHVSGPIAPSSGRILSRAQICCYIYLSN